MIAMRKLVSHFFKECEAFPKIFITDNNFMFLIHGLSLPGGKRLHTILYAVISNRYMNTMQYKPSALVHSVNNEKGIKYTRK